MKTLYIIRHAKSDWPDAGLHDIERPLAPRGLKDAPLMAQVLMKKGRMPEIMISSPALRAFTTCRIFCTELKLDTDAIVIQPELYFGDIALIEKLIQAAFAEADTICIFGHNPTFSVLANHFAPEFGGEMPTCGIVAITFNGSTPEKVEAGKGKMLWFEYPKKNR